MATAEQPLARVIRAARMERTLTQGELATRIGVSQGTISFWEHGVEVPTVEHVLILALELPAIVEHFNERERALFQRVLRLERELFAGRCACTGCSCTSQG